MTDKADIRLTTGCFTIGPELGATVEPGLVCGTSPLESEGSVTLALLLADHVEINEDQVTVELSEMQAERLASRLTTVVERLRLLRRLHKQGALKPGEPPYSDPAKAAHY